MTINTNHVSGNVHNLMAMYIKTQMAFVILFVSYRWSVFGPMDDDILIKSFMLTTNVANILQGDLGNSMWHTTLIGMANKY